ncbi:glutaredoxin family protein [Aestuariibacter salexigens]|uniref:glutaredoxin family protein n=1 Tax=Aestuariibacter salexigens TaxID=226010 RepID=UPI000479B941|nr:glutaredoxin family protein [Aestuariibacter salexigens]
MTILTLYSGQHCHLCDVATTMLQQVSPEAWHETTVVDVSSDPQLRHQYGARIPVLYRNDSREELAWPFDVESLINFLS